MLVLPARVVSRFVTQRRWLPSVLWLCAACAGGGTTARDGAAPDGSTTGGQGGSSLVSDAGDTAGAGTAGRAGTAGTGGPGATGASGAGARSATGGGGTGGGGTGGGGTGGSKASGGNASIGGSSGTAGRGGSPGSGGGNVGGATGPGATCAVSGGVASGPGSWGPAAWGAGPTPTIPTHLDIGAHDPSLIWDGTRYLLLATGGRIGLRASSNLQQWSNAGSLFSATPSWITSTLGTTPADLWAPDVSYFSCQFHVYYAGSSFGSRNSVIGLATSPTLDRNSASYKWTDQGLIVRSQDSDDYNAIDPNVAFDDTGAPWLSFGSFWTGIKMRRLDPATGKTSTSDTTLYSLASRDGGAIEAPSIVSHNGFYYLFVSFDACCKDVSSTYRTMVGRSSKITGPYTNKAGTAMMRGAAEQLLATSGRYIGPGGGTALQMGDRYLYAFHYYDGSDKGAPKLQIRPITFDATDWPALGEPLFP